MKNNCFQRLFITTTTTTRLVKRGHVSSVSVTKMANMSPPRILDKGVDSTGLYSTLGVGVRVDTTNPRIMLDCVYCTHFLVTIAYRYSWVDFYAGDFPPLIMQWSHQSMPMVNRLINGYTLGGGGVYYKIPLDALQRYSEHILYIKLKSYS